LDSETNKESLRRDSFSKTPQIPVKLKEVDKSAIPVNLKEVDKSAERSGQERNLAGGVNSPRSTAHKASSRNLLNSDRNRSREALSFFEVKRLY